MVVAIAVYASSITGNSIWDLFGKKSLSPKNFVDGSVRELDTTVLQNNFLKLDETLDVRDKEMRSILQKAASGVDG